VNESDCPPEHANESTRRARVEALLDYLAVDLGRQLAAADHVAEMAARASPATASRNEVSLR